MDGSDNSSQNYEYIEAMTAKAAKKGVKLIILPEHSDAVTFDDYSYADFIPGKISSFYSSLAAKYSLYVHCGSIPEKNSLLKPYNTSVLFDDKGERIYIKRYIKKNGLHSRNVRNS